MSDIRSPPKFPDISLDADDYSKFKHYTDVHYVMVQQGWKISYFSF